MPSENIILTIWLKMKKESLISKNKIKDFVKSILSTALIVIFLTSAVIEASKVPTPSMEKTILVGDFLFINKFLFGAATPRYIPFTNIELPYFKLPAFREPELNEILVFRYPGDLNQLKDDAVEFWVKRCVGTPGNVIEFRNKVLFVNGKEFPIPKNILYENGPSLPEDLVDPHIFPKGSKWNQDNYGPLKVPKKGDLIKLTSENINIYETLINRELGGKVVSVNNGIVSIDGKPVTEYEIMEDYYFMVGDNRDNSLDSRYWGFVPRENIVGTPILIYWSWNPDIPFLNIFDKLGSVRFDRIGLVVN